MESGSLCWTKLADTGLKSLSQVPGMKGKAADKFLGRIYLHKIYLCLCQAVCHINPVSTANNPWSRHLNAEDGKLSQHWPGVSATNVNKLATLIFNLIVNLTLKYSFARNCWIWTSNLCFKPLVLHATLFKSLPRISHRKHFRQLCVCVSYILPWRDETHLHDVRIDVICDVVALPHFRDLIVLLILVHQIPVFLKKKKKIKTGKMWSLTLYEFLVAAWLVKQ